MRSPLNYVANVMLVTTTASEIQALLEAMENQTMLQLCCHTAAAHGVQLLPYF